MTSQTVDFSIGLARRPWPCSRSLAIERSAGRTFYKASHGSGFQLNLDPTQSRRDQVVDPGPNGAEHKPHRAIEKGREDP